jgi:hypothetical protein
MGENISLLSVLSVISTAFAAIATGFAAWATYRSPKITVETTALIQKQAERRHQRLHIFATIMQYRRYLYFEESVKALNMIDVVFHDNKEVRDAWKDLYSAYGDERLNTNEGGRIKEDLVYNLLRAMANDLGFASDFNADDIRRIYYPMILANHHDLLYFEQDERLRHLKMKLAARTTQNIAPPDKAEEPPPPA